MPTDRDASCVTSLLWGDAKGVHRETADAQFRTAFGTVAGDWHCTCGYRNFAATSFCRKCNGKKCDGILANGPQPASGGGRDGDGARDGG
eukprot:gene6522-7052_t